MGFSHVPSLSIPPNPSVPSRPTVPWDGWDCPWDSHMSHPQVYLQIPVSRPILQSCGMDGTAHGILTCPILKYTSKSQCPVPSYSPVGWTGLPMGFSHVPSLSVYLQIPVSRPVLQSCGMDRTAHGILTCPILEYTPKSQRPIPSYSPMGWMGLSMGFSHVPSSSIPPNPSVPSHPTVLWDGRDCPWDSHMSHPQVYPQIPVSRPILQSCGMDGTAHGILTCPILKYTSKSPVSRPVLQSCGMDRTAHGILTCPILECIPPNPSFPSRPAVLWDGQDCPWDSHMSLPQVYPQIPVSRPVLQFCGMDGTVHGILTCPILKYTPKSQCPVPSCSPVGWTGLSMGFSRPILKYTSKSQCPVPSCSPAGWMGLSMGFSHVPSSSIPPNPSVPSHPAVLWDGWDCPWDSHMSHPQVYPQIPVSRPILQSCGMDGTVHGILTCPILKYTPKSQCPVPSCSSVGWTGLSMGFSHVPSSSIPPNPSVPSHPAVLWDGRDCPWDSHMSHPQVYLQIPVSRPVLQSCRMDGTVHGILTSDPQVYLQIPVSRPVLQSCGMDGTVHGILTSDPQVYLQIPVSRPVLQSCGMDGTVHGILTCPILKYTPKSQCSVPSCSSVGWTGLSMGFSHVPSSSIPPNPSVPSHPAVLWDGWDCPWDSHMSHPQVYPPNPSVPSRPTVLWDGQDCPWDSHMSHPQVYPQIPVSRPVPQSCGMDGIVHGILMYSYWSF